MQSLFQNSFFFRAKLLQSSLFLRIGSYLGQLLFETAIFWWKNCLEKKLSTEELLFKSRYFCTSSTFLGKLHLEKADNTETQYSYFFWKAAFLERPLFQKTLPFIAFTFPEDLLFYKILFQRSYFTATLLFHSYNTYLFVSN